MFRVISEKTGVPEGLPEPPGEVLGLSGPEGRERAAAQEVARPLPWGVRIGLGEGGATTLSLHDALPIWPEGRERAAAQEVARPLPWGVRIGLGDGGAAPLSLYQIGRAHV